MEKKKKKKNNILSNMYCRDIVIMHFWNFGISIGRAMHSKQIHSCVIVKYKLNIQQRAMGGDSLYRAEDAL